MQQQFAGCTKIRIINNLICILEPSIDFVYFKVKYTERLIFTNRAQKKSNKSQLYKHKAHIIYYNQHIFALVYIPAESLSSLFVGLLNHGRVKLNPKFTCRPPFST